ncbi:MAG TPA: AarF/ABC1/UbiB kinase family protein [Planctomycetota bacterium]|nr:AarF/ABC1/UbiB kinase family protein [Planctomycetota bacterium]
MEPKSPTLAELIEALPVEADERDAPRPAGDELRALLAELETRAIPTGRLRRMWSLGTLQAKLAAAYLAWWLRSGFKDADARREGLEETHVAAALAVVSRMSYLRGAVMKFGQVLAHWPDVVPAAFSEVLGHLHSEAPPMHYALVRESLRRELGGDPSRVFAAFETRAFAAASLGQVHRARLKDGRRVAVKVQYPDIARTIREDLLNLKTACFPARLSGDWQNMLAQFEEICATLERETDYLAEARATTRAQEVLADLEDVVVPSVVEEHSGPRVLVTEYLEGLHLDDWLATRPSQPERDAYGERIARASFRLWYSGRTIYADPHPGNFLFLPDGRLGLIDFGCMRAFTDAEFEYVMEVERAAESGDRERIHAALARGCDLPPEALAGERRGKMLAYCDWLWAPVRGDEPFDYSDPAQFRPGVELYGEFTRRGWTRSQPINVWLTKVFFGQRAMLTHLGARVAYGRLMREESLRGHA